MMWGVCDGYEVARELVFIFWMGNGFYKVMGWVYNAAKEPFE